MFFVLGSVFLNKKSIFQFGVSMKLGFEFSNTQYNTVGEWIPIFAQFDILYTSVWMIYLDIPYWFQTYVYYGIHQL